MLRRLRTQIVVLAALAGMTGLLVPTPALSRDGARPEGRVFHRTIGLTHSDLRDPDGIGAAVGEFAASVYGLGAVPPSPDIPLSQFAGTVGEQARRENWASLVLDVWVGGEGSPAGYYVRYQGHAADGDVVRGESFLALPDAVRTPRLARDSVFVRRITDASAGLLGTPERLLDTALR